MWLNFLVSFDTWELKVSPKRRSWIRFEPWILKEQISVKSDYVVGRGWCWPQCSRRRAAPAGAIVTVEWIDTRLWSPPLRWLSLRLYGDPTGKLCFCQLPVRPRADGHQNKVYYFRYSRVTFGYPDTSSLTLATLTVTVEKRQTEMTVTLKID